MVPIDTAAISDSVQCEGAGGYEQHFRHGPCYRLIEVERNTILRIGWRDPDSDGPWLQLIASTLSEAKKDTTSSLPLR